MSLHEHTTITKILMPTWHSLLRLASGVPPVWHCQLQARTELHELLSKPSLVGIPLLVLGNKNDLPTALSTNELIDRLELKVTLLQDRS